MEKRRDNFPRSCPSWGIQLFSPFRWGGLSLRACFIVLLARRVDARLGLAALLQLALFAAVYDAAGSSQSGTLADFMLDTT